MTGHAADRRRRPVHRDLLPDAGRPGPLVRRTAGGRRSGLPGRADGGRAPAVPPVLVRVYRQWPALTDAIPVARTGVARTGRGRLAVRVARVAVRVIRGLPALAGPVFLLPGPGQHLRGQYRQVPQAQPAPRRAHQDRVGLVPRRQGKLVRPDAYRPGERLRDIPGGQHREHLRMRHGPLGPCRVGHRRGPGDPRLVNQPRPGTVIRIRGMPFPGGERPQHRRPGGSGDCGHPLQAPEAARLLPGGQPGGVRGGQVTQRGAGHVHCLGDAHRRWHGALRNGAHPGFHLPG